MKSEHKLCGVILAAGQSSRMGRDKALLRWPPSARAGEAAAGETLLAATIKALKAQCEAVLVVAGRNAGTLAPVVAACGAAMVVNHDPDRGQFSSLQAGLGEAVKRGYDAAMIMPVDCPPPASATLKILRAEFERAVAAGKWAVEPENNGRHGHPLLAARELVRAFLNAPDTANAREVKRAHAEATEYVAVPETLICVDLNTPEEYAKLAEEAGDALPSA